ncbi:putative membrane protein [Brucella inopinata]|nr:putative membrane protein [Brucella inopinata]
MIWALIPNRLKYSLAALVAAFLLAAGGIHIRNDKRAPAGSFGGSRGNSKGNTKKGGR